MAFAPRRRRRRSRWILAGVMFSLLALAVNAGLSSRSHGPGERLAGLAYVDEVRPFVEASSVQGTDVAEVRAAGAALGPNGIRRTMKRVSREAGTQLRGVRQVDPPPELAANHSLLVSTMLLRVRAATMMGKALDDALGAGPVEPAVDALVKAAGDLIAADHIYSALMELVIVKGARSPLLPASTWVADPSAWTGPEVSAFVSALKASTIPTPVHDVSVLTVITDPRPVATESGSAVLPALKALRLEVVVANLGNTAEKGVAVVANLVGPAGEVDTAREFVDLAPGQRRTVVLGGLRPAVGGPSTLKVIIGPVEGEGGANDNERSLSLVVRG